MLAIPDHLTAGLLARARRRQAAPRRALARISPTEASRRADAAIAALEAGLVASGAIKGTA